MTRVGVADHVEQAHVLILAVDGPAAVEYLVPAVLRVCLGEHHELDVVRIAAEGEKMLEQVVDLVVAESEPHVAVGLLEPFTALGNHVDAAKRARRGMVEQHMHVLDAGKNRLGHAIVHAWRQHATQQAVGIGAGLQVHRPAHPALDARHLGEPAIVQNVRGLAGPWRNRSGARCDDECAMRGAGGHVRACVEQRAQEILLRRRKCVVVLDEVEEFRVEVAQPGQLPGQAFMQALRAKCRQRRASAQVRLRCDTWFAYAHGEARDDT